jgi:hypothetical protein
MTFKDYSSRLIQVVEEVDPLAVQSLADAILDCYREDRWVFIIGKTWLEDQFCVPAVVLNDAAGLAESRLGAGKGHREHEKLYSWVQRRG